MTDRYDDDLMRLSGSGDNAAFAALVGRHTAKISRHRQRPKREDACYSSQQIVERVSIRDCFASPRMILGLVMKA